MAEQKRPNRTQIMTLKEISKYLGVHEMTVYRLLKTKKLPGFKIGGQWRTKKEVLDQWLLKDLDTTGMTKTPQALKRLNGQPITEAIA